MSPEVEERRRRAAEQVAELSARLRRAMDDAGLSLRDVEERIGMARDYLSQLLRGTVDLKLKHVFVILDALGIEEPEAVGLAVPKRDHEAERELERTRRLLASPEIDALLEDKIRATVDPILRELRRPDRG